MSSTPVSSSIKAPTQQQQHVRVGVGVIIKDPLKPNHIFAGIRRGSHGSGLLALPGGHLELFESWRECAKREVEEETGLVIDLEDIQFGHVTNDIMKSEGKHYVTIFMMAQCKNNSKGDNDDDNDDDEVQRPKNLEPNKCDGWDSYTWDTLVDIAKGSHDNTDDAVDSGFKLFGPFQKLVEESPEKVIQFINMT